jgi:hypothetical protein
MWPKQRRQLSLHTIAINEKIPQRQLLLRPQILFLVAASRRRA